MKICFLTELPFFGNVNIRETHNIPDNSYDIGILIVPKTLHNYADIPILEELKRIANKTSFMQEGPSWFYQDIPLNLSIHFFNIMNGVDFVLAHNECDRVYYEGLLNKPAYINPTLMIEDAIGTLKTAIRKDVIIGGNFGRWYGGFDSYVVANQFECDIYAPSMGRMKDEELVIDGIQHLPYLNWKQWIHKLNDFKYAVHLNPNTIGGTFYLNCAYLGIPCIGNINANTQRLCFPDTSINVQNLGHAKEIANKLKTDIDFYNHCSNQAKELYMKNFHKSVYIQQLESIIKKVL
jgi:hypothetical protein